MQSLEGRVRRFIRERHLIGQADRVAVGVSGGADSVALTLVLARLAAGSAWTLAGLIHVHHGIRPEADADADFVVALGQRLGLPVEVRRVDVPALARRERRSVEAVARDARYRAFEVAADRLDATLVATGHTMDDQAETVLLRLLRGAGTRGVSAIRPRRGRFVRPLLGCRRAELRRRLEASGEAFRDDATNLDLRVPRNRLRHELLPVIEQLETGGVPALARFAELAAADEAQLAAEALAASAAGVRIGPDGVELNRASVNALPLALARRVVRGAVEQAGGVVTFRDVAAVLALSRDGRVGASLDLHGLRACLTAEVLTIGHPGPDGPAPAAEPVELPIPGRVRFGDQVLTAGRVPPDGAGGQPVFGREACRVLLQAGEVREPLLVRRRQPGDRFRPLGAPGRRKVQDVLVDRRIARARRDLVPVVVDAGGRIVWLAGVAMAHECRVTAPEAGMVTLELEKRDQ